MTQIRIDDHSDHGQCTKGIDKSILTKGSLLPLMHIDLSDFGTSCFRFSQRNQPYDNC